MDAGSCSLLAGNLSLGNLSLGNLSKTCALPGVAVEKGQVIEVSLARWLANYVYELSCAELRLPGTPLALYLGSFAGMIELTLVMLLGSALMATCGFLGHRLRSSSCVPQAAKAVIFTAVGVALPLLPFVVLAIRGRMHSPLGNFAMSLIGVLGFFRWIELAVRSGPKGFDHSGRSSALYFGVLCEVLFDDDGLALAAPKGRRWQLFWSTLGHTAAMLFLLAVGHVTNFTPFLGPNADILAMPAMGLPVSLPAIWLQAAYVYLMLNVMMELICFSCAVFGVEAQRPMRHPLLLSTSVRDFWGRRWNLLVHRLMHRNFFTPLAGRIGPRAGAMAAFLASALFHEYMWLLANYEVEDYLPGLPLAFFGVQFVLLTGEALLRRTKLGAAARALPAPVQTVLTTLAILPFGPVFLAGLHRSGFMMEAVRIFPNPRLVSM